MIQLRTGAGHFARYGSAVSASPEGFDRRAILVNAAATALRAGRGPWHRAGADLSATTGQSRAVWTAVKHYCRLAGIPAERPTSALKHTCGHCSCQAARGIVDVQKHLGRDIATMIYAQLTDEANRERAEQLRNWR
jgi:hypothetical protein